MSFGGGSSSGSTQQTGVTPYAPAQPALNQIISEAGNLYNQGVAASGYVAPTQQTLTGLAQQDICRAPAIATNVNAQFSGAGRTPGSPMNQNQIVTQVAQAALPLAFGEYGQERNRQLQIASRAPSLFTTGRQLEQLTREQNLAPFQSLQQYSGIVSLIAAGFPVTNQQVNTRANPLTTAMGGAMIGSAIPGIGPLIGGGIGLLGGLL